MRRFPGRLLAVVMSVLLLVCGCTSDKDRVSSEVFNFVSPGGKVEFSYPPDQRRAVGEMAGPDLAGDRTLSIADYRGKVVVLNFWGSWCPPCRLEAPGLQAASEDLAPDGVQFLGVNVRDVKGAGAAFNASKGVTYPSIFDPSMRTLLSVRGLPTTAFPITMVLDRQGRVAHIWLRDVAKQDVIDVVTPIAAETG